MTVLPLPPQRRPAHDPLPRGAVRGRNGEILTRRFDGDNMPDQYDVPPECREAGWDLQWVRVSCHGEPDGQNYNVHYANGWRPVPGDRVPDHSQIAPSDTIVRDGLMLMERPKVLSDEAMSQSQRAAHRQKYNIRAEFEGGKKAVEESRDAHHGGFVPATSDVDSRGVAKASVRSEIERAPTNLYPERQYAIGDED